MANSETILTLTYDFLLYLIPQLSKYPRDQKFVLGDRIETLALDILDDVIVAYYSKQKLERLQNANLKLEAFKVSNSLKSRSEIVEQPEIGGPFTEDQ